MNIWLKFLIGLAAACAVGFVSHSAFGRGEAFINTLDASAQQVVRGSGLAGISAHMTRDPLARTVIMSGPANYFQRTGRLSERDPGDRSGETLGLDQRMLRIPGMGGVEWTNPPS
jgi:hypothetical protein